MNTSRAKPIPIRYYAILTRCSRSGRTLQGCAFASRAIDAEARTAGLAADRLRAAGYEVTTGIGRRPAWIGLLRNGEGADRHAARRHGHFRSGSDGSCLRQQGDGHRSRRPYGSRGAHVRSRYACHLARGCHEAAGGSAEFLGASTLMAVFRPAKKRRRRTGHDRRWPVQAFPKPDVILGQHVMVVLREQSQGDRRDHVGGGQPANPSYSGAVRTARCGPASVPSSRRPPRPCGFQRSYRAKWPPLKPPF